MSNCGNKINSTCGELVQAGCVEYEETLPDFSEITGCPRLDQTTQELYKFVGELKTQTDLSELGEECLTYVLESGKIVVKNVLLKMEEEICELKQQITDLQNRQLCDIPIGDCITDLSCLVLPCDTSIVTLGDWMKAMSIKVCETP